MHELFLDQDFESVRDTFTNVMRPTAFCYIRKDSNPVPELRKWPGIEVRAGLERCGFELKYKYDIHKNNDTLYPWDLLVTWTLWRQTHRRSCADMHKQLGGVTLCMENGWIKRIRDKNYYQLAFREDYGSGINGQGRFPIKDDSRWKSWNVKLAPWRSTGSHVLVCAQRGVRPQDPDITHGPEWANTVMQKIRKATDRPVWWRWHPGNRRPCVPTGQNKPDRIIDPHAESLASNFKDAWCTVVYTSTSANDSLISGVPVCYDGPMIMCDKLARRVKDIENPCLDDREEVMSKLAWGQWNLRELCSGLAFRHVLGLE